MRTRPLGDDPETTSRPARAFRRLLWVLAAYALASLVACGPRQGGTPHPLTGTWRRGLPGVETDVLEVSVDGRYRRLRLGLTDSREESGRVVSLAAGWLFAPLEVDGARALDDDPFALANEVFVERTRAGRTWLLSNRALEDWERLVDAVASEPVPTTYCPHYAPLLAGG